MCESWISRPSALEVRATRVRRGPGGNPNGIGTRVAVGQKPNAKAVVKTSRCGLADRGASRRVPARRHRLRPFSFSTCVLAGEERRASDATADPAAGCPMAAAVPMACPDAAPVAGRPFAGSGRFYAAFGVWNRRRTKILALATSWLTHTSTARQSAAAVTRPRPLDLLQ